jgi:hypothetical protein
MSIATTAMTTTATTMDDGFEPYPPSEQSLHRRWPEKEQIELRIQSDARPGRDSLRYNSQQYHVRLSAIDTECLFPDDGFSTSDQRPSSSRSHLLQWRRNPSASSDPTKHPRVSSDLQPPTPDNRPSATITREEFESLPPTIQRKVSSCLSLLCEFYALCSIFCFCWSSSIRRLGSSKRKSKPLDMRSMDCRCHCHANPQSSLFHHSFSKKQTEFCTSTSVFALLLWVKSRSPAQAERSRIIMTLQG